METQKKNNHYFAEWWKKQAINFAAKKGVSIEDLIPKIGKIHVRNGMFARSEPAPIFLMEWAENNPEPQITRDEFIVTLAKRVEALEAKLGKEVEV